MSIRTYYLKSNERRYFDVISYTDYDNIRRQKKIIGKTRSECKQKCDDFKKSLLLEKERITFSELYQRYINDCEEQNLKSTTLNTKRSIIETYILSYFKDTDISKIDRKMISNLYKEISKKQIEKTGDDFSEEYKRCIRTQLSCILNYAVKSKYIEKNYNKNINFGSKSSRLYEIWNSENFETFISEFKNDLMYKTIFVLLWTTGLRVGELLGLRYSDFDFTNNTLNVSRNYQEKQTQTTKTTSSVRTIQVSQVTMNLIKEYHDRCRYIDDKERLFLTSKYNLKKVKDRVCIKTGVKKIRLHDIRHSFITLQIDNKVNVQVVAQMVGHKDIRTTLDVYYHCKRDEQIQISNFYDKTLSNI